MMHGQRNVKIFPSLI